MSQDKNYFSLPMRDFLADLAAKSPVPSGGAVAAVLGSLAASQARMVIEYSIGKKKAAGHDDRLQQSLDELVRTEKTFEHLLSEDVTAYERFASARKSGEPETLERALAAVVSVPMEIIVLAGTVAARMDEIKAWVNPNLLSELQVSAILAYSSARSACTCVRVNLENLADRKEAERLENQLDMLVGRTGRHRNAIVHYGPL